MKTYTQVLKAMKDYHENREKLLKKHRRMLGIANKHAGVFAKANKEMDVSTSYTDSVPSVDIDIHLGRLDPIKSVYPLVDALIRDPRLDMHKPLPKEILSTDSCFHCSFKKKGSEKTIPLLRVYVFVSESRVCVPVGTGRYKEITRIACGHYDEEGNFVEDTNEDNQ